MVKKLDVSKIIEKVGKNPKDTGSPEVQIALLTERINYLSKHLTENPKDFDARRRLSIILSKRKALLKYLERNNFDAYKKIKEIVGLK